VKPLFIFCGPIGSGKSAVSKTLAKKIGAAWNSFGTTCKEIAIERNVPIKREELQQLGAHLIEREREMFCKRVLGPILSDGSICGVIDGLRHANVLHELRSLIKPRKIICIYVDVSMDIRLNRVSKRDGIEAEELAKLDSHSTEVQVKTELRELADFTANNNGTPEECTDNILNWAGQIFH
jgi:dephospho-CoA kinase